MAERDVAARVSERAAAIDLLSCGSSHCAASAEAGDGKPGGYSSVTSSGCSVGFGLLPCGTLYPTSTSYSRSPGIAELLCRILQLLTEGAVKPSDPIDPSQLLQLSVAKRRARLNVYSK